MDENTWRLAELLLVVMGIQTTVIIALFGALWAYMIKRFDKVDAKFDRVDARLIDIEKRVGQIEGAMMTKECCMLKGDSQLRKAE